MIINFGKHRGEKLEDVPMQYVLFLAGYKLDGTKRSRCTLPASEWVEQSRPEIRSAAKEFLLGRCWHCGGKLKPVGYSRLNGEGHEYWQGRILHKSRSE